MPRPEDVSLFFEVHLNVRIRDIPFIVSNLEVVSLALAGDLRHRTTFVRPRWITIHCAGGVTAAHLVVRSNTNDEEEPIAEGTLGFGVLG